MTIDLAHPSPGAVPLSTSLMRYMDVGKFFDLLSSGELHFARQDLLREDDPREGRLPDIVRRDWADLLSMSLEEIRSDPRFAADEASELKRIAELMFRGAENFARTAYVSCWHMGAAESMAMWSMYAGRGAAVAVTTTVDRLCAACSPTERAMIGGAIKYIDPHNVAFTFGNLFDHSFRKHHAFEFEREFRIAFSSSGDRLKEGQAFSDLFDPREFLRVKVSLSTLIEKITPSPKMPEREFRLVQKLAGDYGFGDQLGSSALSFSL